MFAERMQITEMSNLPKPYDHIVSTEFDDGDGVLVDLETKSYYQLNQTAMLVWLGLEKGQILSELINRITSTYDVTDAPAAASVEKILQDFRSKNLLQS